MYGIRSDHQVALRRGQCKCGVRRYHTSETKRQKTKEHIAYVYTEGMRITRRRKKGRKVLYISLCNIGSSVCALSRLSFRHSTIRRPFVSRLAPPKCIWFVRASPNGFMTTNTKTESRAALHRQQRQDRHPVGGRRTSRPSTTKQIVRQKIVSRVTLHFDRNGHHANQLRDRATTFHTETLIAFRSSVSWFLLLVSRPGGRKKDESEGRITTAFL